ncbi:hypothetical protein ACFPRL_28450 [Pseudoclavibacter helvolus]
MGSSQAFGHRKVRCTRLKCARCGHTDRSCATPTEMCARNSRFTLSR